MALRFIVVVATLGTVLNLSLLGELGGAFEFGHYSRHFDSPVFYRCESVRA
ncbi:MAG: hypothetical protein KatS3mg040_0093 [Candidatus Kapaibacterium sp.]|nr:MAG: hypothetical protein KatS3mg040_0093 [Candidatus Kapabacteria bacterium]